MTAWLASAPALAQPVDETEQSRMAADLREYHALVDTYRAGDESAPRQLLAWTPKKLEVTLALVQIPGSGTAPWDSRRVAAAAFMHADAAVILFDAKDRSGGLMHLEFAGRLFEKGAPALDPLARRWYFAVSRVLRDRVWLGAEQKLLESGRRQFPTDPGILCESGTLEEYLATDRSIRFSGGPMATSAASILERFKVRRRGSLANAADWLWQAAEHGSADVLCRVHLGRAWTLVGDARGEPLLSELQEHSDDAVSYLASMFLGGSAQRRNEPAIAERQYRRAIARFPRGQSAYVALSAVLLASGRVAEARDVVRQAVGHPQNDRREPWWWYHVEPSVVADDRFAALKREALR